MFRRSNSVALKALALLCAIFLIPPDSSAAQKKTDAAPSAEAVAETVILVHGVRERLAQIRKSGIERGRMTRISTDGRSEEITYERSFKRGENVEKDKIRLDQRMPSIEYSLVYNEGKVFGVVRGTSFTPRQRDVSDFLADTKHGVETLLRYKENGATLAFVGKEKQKGIDMWVLDLTDKEKGKTRFFVSSQTGRVLWLEYEQAESGSVAPVKYRRTFHDYRTVQGTRVPYRSVLYADGKQVEELQILTVVYGVKMDDSVFQNPA